MKKSKRKPVVKKVALKKGTVARVILPAGLTPLVHHHSEGVVDILPVEPAVKKPKEQQGWWRWLLYGPDDSER